MNADNRENITLDIKMGSQLDQSELGQMIAALYREFKINTSPEKFKDRLFFLVKDKSEILAMGGLWKVFPFAFDGVDYTVYGVVEVVANRRAQGYGKRVMTAMRDYMITNNLTGFGFCSLKNQGFYKKCGFEIATDVTQRFIYRHEGKDITNQDGQIIFYQDSSDQFMKKVLESPSIEVLIPTQDLW